MKNIFFAVVIVLAAFACKPPKPATEPKADSTATSHPKPDTSISTQTDTSASRQRDTSQHN